MTLLQRLNGKKKDTSGGEEGISQQTLEDLKERVRQHLIARIDMKVFGSGEGSLLKEELYKKVEQLVATESSAQHLFLAQEEKDRIVNDFVDEIFGFGPLTDLMKDATVSEIMVNGPKQVFVERNGKMTLTDITFKDDAHLLYIIKKLVSLAGRRIDESMPYVDISLGEGTRVNAIIPPLSLNGPVMTIRKLCKEISQIEDLIRLGTLTREAADFLVTAVKERKNIIFSGGTGAGKTTTLSILSGFIAPDERIVTIEDTAELYLRQRHWVRLETRRPNIEGKGEVTIRDLLKNALRMRPERIIVGEVRGGEALDMLQAICSGHNGSLAVVHANSPSDVISRLETMILTSGVELPMWAIRKQIASAIDLIVHQEQLADGKRQITHITEVRGVEKDEVVLEDMFVFKQKEGLVKCS